MPETYPPESQHLDFIGHLEELRRRILIIIAVLGLTGIAFFSQGQVLMRLVTRPLKNLNHELIFISPTEVLAAFIKISLLAGFIVSFPVLLYELWRFLSPAMDKNVRKHLVFWMLLALAGFVAGTGFSYTIAVPAALRFLLNFGQGVATAQITLGRYVSFFTAFLLIGGLIFEIPVIMALLAEAGVLKTKIIKEKRAYAVVGILGIAAVITPTQDIFNMLIFALPMYVLFEIGVSLTGFVERRKHG